MLFFLYLILILLVVSSFDYFVKLIFIFNLALQSKIFHPPSLSLFKFNHHSFNCYFFFWIIFCDWFFFNFIFLHLIFFNFELYGFCFVLVLPIKWLGSWVLYANMILNFLKLIFFFDLITWRWFFFLKKKLHGFLHFPLLYDFLDLITWHMGLIG